MENNLAKDADGKYMTGRGRGDWEDRFGVSHPVISLRPLWPYTVTHKVRFEQDQKDLINKFAFMWSYVFLSFLFTVTVKLRDQMKGPS